jgi:hypothetical protein
MKACIHSFGEKRIVQGYQRSFREGSEEDATEQSSVSRSNQYFQNSELGHARNLAFSCVDPVRKSDRLRWRVALMNTHTREFPSGEYDPKTQAQNARGNQLKSHGL